ncbi:MAG: polysaccharide ABC transporter ATP-binding protein [Chloroflexota bacterium]|nr:polysaccharide ABC transporter ATP-binding protein [Chloroflexota bacterium]
MTDQLPLGSVICDKVSKRYRLGAFGSLRGTVSSLFERRSEEEEAQRTLWALQDVSFRLQPGESLGLLGPNGAGKTTTLKLLSKITRPTSGNITLLGRSSSLIELGAGFHPELTGKENIFLNGAILGLSRHEIQRRLDEIIAFSELERFIDTPVKRYSSGMYVRLGFAVAAYVEPNVLLVDEVLAVGDISFRQRCIKRMKELQESGTTVIFVSHNMHLVRNMCQRSLLLVHGQIQSEGPTDDVIADYERLIMGTAELANDKSQDKDQSQVLSDVIVLNVDVAPLTPNDRNLIDSHQSGVVTIRYRTQAPREIGRIDVRVLRDDGTLCSSLDARAAAKNDPRFRHLDREGSFVLTFSPMQLTSGTYFVLVRITDSSDALVIASGQSKLFQAYAGDLPSPPGVFVPSVAWDVGKENRS